jgi:hypothetical protein
MGNTSWQHTSRPIHHFFRYCPFVSCRPSMQSSVLCDSSSLLRLIQSARTAWHIVIGAFVSYRPVSCPRLGRLQGLHGTSCGLMCCADKFITGLSQPLYKPSSARRAAKSLMDWVPDAGPLAVSGTLARVPNVGWLTLTLPLLLPLPMLLISSIKDIVIFCTSCSVSDDEL